jgi:hypothetical protein
MKQGMETSTSNRAWMAEAMDHRYSYVPWRWFWEGPQLVLATLSGRPTGDVYTARLLNEPPPSDQSLFLRVVLAGKLFYLLALVLPLVILGPAAVMLLQSGSVFGYIFAVLTACITVSNLYRIFVARPIY